MSLLLLLKSSGPTAQAGIRSLLAFWIGGASAVPEATYLYPRSRVVNPGAAGGTGYTRTSIVNAGGI